MSPGLVLLPLRTSIPEQREVGACSQTQADEPPSKAFLTLRETGTRKGMCQARQPLPQSPGSRSVCVGWGWGGQPSGENCRGQEWDCVERDKALPSRLLRTSLRCGDNPALSPLGAFDVGSAGSSVAIGNGDVTGRGRSLSYALS